MTLPATTPRPVTALRRIPVRQTEPPYDDERPQPARSHPRGQPALALTFPDERSQRGRPALALVPPPIPVPDDETPRPTPYTQLPPPRPWAGRLVQGVLEVVAGDRPAAQLVRWLSAPVYAELVAAASGGATRTGPGTTTLAARGSARRLVPTAGVVRSVHVTSPTPTSAEVCVVIARGTRCGAVALRLDGLDGRWLCTALELG